MKRIYLYLFIFSVLLNVFTYMYFTKKAKYESENIQKKEAKVQNKQAVIDSLEIKLFEMSHYTLRGNGFAQDYVERYFDYNNLEKIRDSILELNHLKEGNSLVGFDSSDDVFVISRMEFLNHRWILADFDNRALGGQLLVRYYLNDDGTFELETVDRAFYLPKPQIEE
ncbi:MAG: hypothetical protein AB7D46_02325 [Flavobacteriaceae bacterium]